MIVIQVRLASVSIFYLSSAVITICPIVLGLLLATHAYTHARALQIPSALVSASAIVCSISQLCGIIWSYKLAMGIINILASTLLAGSGLYYLGQRLRDLDRIAYTITERYTRIEVAFTILWLVSLLASVAVTLFSFGAMYIAHCGPENDIAGYSDSDVIYEKGSPQQFQEYPLDIPTGSTFAQLSPRLTWPSSLGSLGRVDSLNSIESLRNNTTIPGRPQFTRIHTPPQPTGLTNPCLSNPTLATPGLTTPGLATPGLANPGLATPGLATPGGHNGNNGGDTKSITKVPKSPLKIHLSRSSFSLRRAGSKASMAQPRPAPANKSPPINQATTQVIDPVSLGIPSGLRPEPPKSWVMIPNENVAESRSVSGSSQLTGKIFPAAEYNRKLNSAGFLRDEPVPVQVQVLQNRNTVSQYDLEQMHRQTRTH